MVNSTTCASPSADMYKTQKIARRTKTMGKMPRPTESMMSRHSWNQDPICRTRAARKTRMIRIMRSQPRLPKGRSVSSSARRTSRMLRAMTTKSKIFHLTRKNCRPSRTSRATISNPNNTANKISTMRIQVSASWPFHAFCILTVRAQLMKTILAITRKHEANCTRLCHRIFCSMPMPAMFVSTPLLNVNRVGVEFISTSCKSFKMSASHSVASPLLSWLDTSNKLPRLLKWLTWALNGVSLTAETC
mmetsp:Transcript_81056/g.160641  ORF Transcript_81056/g.160641 Transcript_81056/m.160641 type:complete len:247 (-) Transcript_81056:347-1087(-)